MNTNDQVRVKLTDYGKAILHAYDSITIAMVATTARIYIRKEVSDKRKPDADGAYGFVFWELMEIFGPHTSRAAPQIFEKNEIEIVLPVSASKEARR